MAVERSRYGKSAVYGSLAYDFNSPELYPDTEYGQPLERPAPNHTNERIGAQPRVRTRTRVRVQTKQGVSPLAIMGILVAAAIFVVFILAQIQLIDVSAKSVELQSQLAELQTEQAKLQIKYESVFNLTEIEEYAVSELGMQKPSANQIYYIDTSSPDRAVVIQEAGSEGFAEKVSDFISGIGAYFR